MDKIIGVHLNLDGNQIKNVVLHSLSGSTPSGPTVGQVYYDIANDAPYYYSQSGWVTMSASSGLPRWSNIIGGVLTSQSLYVGNSGLLTYTGAGIINVNQFFGSGVVPVEKGGTGRSTFVSGAIIYGGVNDQQLQSDSSGLYYYAGRKSLGVGSLTSLPRATIHIGTQISDRPGLILSTDALSTGSLSNYIGALQFNGDKLFYINGGASYKQIIDIDISGKLSLLQGGTNNTIFNSGGLVYVSGNSLQSLIGLNSVVLGGSGSTPPSFVSAINSGYVLTTNGTTWVSAPFPPSTGDVRIYPDSAVQQSIYLLEASPLYLNAASHTTDIMVVSGLTTPLFILDGSGNIRVHQNVSFGVTKSLSLPPTIKGFSNQSATDHGGIYFGSIVSGFQGGIISVVGSGGNGGSFLAEGLTGNAGSIDISAKNNGAAGSINLYSLGTNAGGSINMRGNLGGEAGSINTDAGTSGVGGDINTYGTNNAAGGAINTYGGSVNSADGGEINTYGMNSPGGDIFTIGGLTTNTAGGSIYTNGGSSVNAHGGNIDLRGISYRGGSLITANGGGSLDTYSGFIELGTLVNGRSVIYKSNNTSGTLNTYLLPEFNGGTLIADELAGAAGQLRMGASGRRTYLQGSIPAGTGDVILFLPNPFPTASTATLALRHDLPTGLISLSNISGYSPTSGQFLGWNGIVWRPATVSASGGTGATTLDELTDVTIATALSGSFIRYNGSQWINISGIAHTDLLDVDVDVHDQYVATAPTTNARNKITPADETFTALWLQQGGFVEIPQEVDLFIGECADSCKRIRWYADTGRVNHLTFNLETSLLNGSQFRFYEPSGVGSGYIGFAPASGLSAFTNYIIPQDSTSGYFLKTRGDGRLEWVAGGAGATLLDDLTDVTIDAAASGDYLKYNGSQWGNVTGLNLSHSHLTNLTSDDHRQYIHNTASLSSRNVISGGNSETRIIAFKQGTDSEIAQTVNLVEFKDVNARVSMAWQKFNSATDLALYLNIPIFLDNRNQLRFYESSGNGESYIAHRAADSLTGNTFYSWPFDGASGTVLNTDGTGNLTWKKPVLSDIGATWDGGSVVISTGLVTRRPIEQNSQLLAAAIVTNGNSGYINIEVGKYTPAGGALGVKTYLGNISITDMEYSRDTLTGWSGTTVNHGDVLSFSISGTPVLFNHVSLVISRETL